MTRTIYEFHEFANIFSLDEEHLGELAEDIREHGLRCPVELFDGKIIDGRRRYLACEKAEVDPDYVEVKPDDPVAYVVSLNVHRRHLTLSQSAMCAARVHDIYAQQAKERQKVRKGNQPGATPDNCPELEDQGDARDQAGKPFGVSGKSVDRARRVIRNGVPGLIELVERGKLSVNKAVTIADHSPALQQQLLKSNDGRKQVSSPKARPEEKEDDPPPGTSRGVGVDRANEAINCLMRIPKNDRLRKRGFQIVTDWIKSNS